jgi:pyruvate/2-oxoacid:ferredoxin oxidoreductase beta subunit
MGANSLAQTTASHINHFYRAVMEANEYPGPAVINVYTTCQPEHGVLDSMSAQQAKLAVESRAFPLFIYAAQGRKAPELSRRQSGAEKTVDPAQEQSARLSTSRARGRFANSSTKMERRRRRY